MLLSNVRKLFLLPSMERKLFLLPSIFLFFFPLPLQRFLFPLPLQRFSPAVNFSFHAQRTVIFLHFLFFLVSFLAVSKTTASLFCCSSYASFTHNFNCFANSFAPLASSK